MAALTINVGVIAGTDIGDCIAEMINLRIRTGANIEASFNGVGIFVCRDNQTVEALTEKYHELLGVENRQPWQFVS